MRFQGKVAVVTGASRGIGRGIALRLAHEGAIVVVDYVHSKKKAGEVVEKIKSEGGKGIAVKADVSKISEVQAMVDLTVKKFNHIDILVSNAGIDPNLHNIKQTGILEMSEELWNTVLNTNLKGAFLCCQAVAREMVKQNKGGRIIIISSVHGKVTVSEHGAYSASKGGLNMLTKELALELAPFRINVNAVAPGPIEIERYFATFPDYDRKILGRQVPIGRVGLPEDIAHAVTFFASEEASFITGQILYVDGGVTARLALQVLGVGDSAEGS